VIRRSATDRVVSDEALLASMALGDERAAVMFVRRYQRRIYGLARALLGNDALAEEVSQEAMLRVWRHAPVFDARRASVATWVLTITRNLAIDALRVRRSVPVDPASMVELLGGDDSVDRAVDSSIAQRTVRLALSSLPLEQRRAVVLAALYGHSAAEVAEYESIPLGTAQGRIRLGLVKLRAELLEQEASA
jgi:RNA polymerase sigma-70 factor (ECF subfamily)